MSAELEKRMKEVEAKIVFLNEKALSLLVTCLKHEKEISAITDIIEEIVVGKPEEKNMMASLANDIAKARASHLN